MTKNHRRLIAVLPAVLLAFCAIFSPSARALGGSEGMEEVPGNTEGIEAQFPVTPGPDALVSGNVDGSMDLRDADLLANAGLQPEARDAAVQPSNPGAKLPWREVLEQKRTQRLTGNSSSVDKAALQSQEPASAESVSAQGTPGIASQSGEGEVANAPAQARAVAGDVIEPENGSQGAKVNTAGFDGESISAATDESAVSETPEPANGSVQDRVNWANSTLRLVRAQWDKVIVGQNEAKDAMMTSLIAHGHAFLESAPGLGKTTLAKAVANSISANFKRVQGTADLLPSDIIGSVVLKKAPNGDVTFEFEKGPIFTDILLFDEINRAPPKTLSAVLEAMEERQVTVQGQTYPLPKDFTVFATQNPLEEQGVFSTPYAAQDRFLAKVPVTKPSEAELTRIMELNRDSSAKPKAGKTTTLSTLDRIRKVALSLTLKPEVQSYIARIVEAANNHKEIKSGHVISPRAAIGIEISARIHAMMAGRTWVSPDDVAAVVPLILRHRLIIGYDQETTPDDLINKILSDVPVGEAKPTK